MAIPNDVEKFLQAIFPDYDKFAIFAHSVDHPDPKKRMKHVRTLVGLDVTRDCYWSIAAFPEDVSTERTLIRALDVRALVIDDVGTKVSIGAVELALGPPTTIVESSAGNFQWGYRLSKPVAKSDWPAFADAVQAMIGVKLDHGYNDAVHLFRLPMGVHTKKGNFPVRLVPSDPTVELDPATIPYVSGPSRVRTSKDPNDGRIKNIRRLVALVPNDTGYWPWIARMHQIWVLAKDKEEGREAFREFSARWTDPNSSGDAGDPDAKWDSIREDDVTTVGQLLLDDAYHADPDEFSRIMNDEARQVFPDDAASAVERDAALAALAVQVAGTIEFTLDQQGTARRVLAVLGGTVRKVGKDNWRQFDPTTGRWLFQPGNHMLRLVEEALQARRAVGPLAGAGVNKKSYLAAVAELAAIHSSVIGQEKDFDADPLLLGVPSGVINLRAGKSREIRQGRPGDMVSRSMRVDPAPVGTTHPVWSKFLGEFTQADRALEEWLQIFAGYCLTGLRGDHVMPFIYGGGTNGKSVFVNALRSVWGEYGKPVDHRLLFEKAGGYHLAPLAALSGARLATVTDVPQGAVWDMHIVKMLISEDPVEANRMHQDPIVFELMAKFVVSGNHQPTVKDMDEGVKRRLRLLPMTHEVDEKVIDLQLAAKLRGEYEAIFRWALDGLNKYWRRGKLGTCSAITDATDEYTTMLDPFGRWIKTLVPDTGQGVKPNDLYRSWSDFRMAENCHGTMPNSAATLVKKLKEKKFFFSLSDGRPYLRGYKLGPSAATDVF